jgi:hypothetical protein
MREKVEAQGVVSDPAKPGSLARAMFACWGGKRVSGRSGPQLALILRMLG